MNISRALVWAIIAGLLCAVSLQAKAGVVQLNDPLAEPFATIIDFNSPPGGTAVLDQFAGSDGVKFRDQNSLFGGAPANGSPGTIRDSGGVDDSGFLRANKNEGQDYPDPIFVIFETPVRQVGARVRAFDDDDDEGEESDDDSETASISLTAFDGNLDPLGEVIVDAGSEFVLLALLSDMGAISSVKFSLTGGDDDGNLDFDNLGFSPVPLPGALPLFLTALAGLGLISRQRRRRPRSV